MTAVLALLVSAVTLLVAAALRAAGASLIRTSRADALHDAAEGDSRAARVADLLDEKVRLQPALGMVHSALLVAVAIPSAWALSHAADTWLLAVGLVALGLVLVLLGDLLPRSWGRAHPRHLAYRLAFLLSPAFRLGSRAVDLVTEEEEEGHEEEDEEAEAEAEKQLISSVLEFTDAVVREIMVPRTDMVIASAITSTDEALDLIVGEGVSRIPVAGEGPDDIVGILYAKDVLRVLDRGEQPKTVGEIMRPAYFVPETKRISQLLRDMQANRVHMAIVVDEFGGTAGLVTIEDVLEELVGEIADEYDTEEPMAEPLAEGGYLVDARMAVDDLGELFRVDLPDEGWDTVGGLVLALAGQVPREGESFELDGLCFTTDRVQGRRVARVRATRL